MILGIDVGCKNIGVCVVDAADPAAPRIAQWAVWSAEGSWAPEVHACLAAHATDEFLEGVTRVVVERQPSKNPTMVRIQHYVEYYFVGVRGLPVAMQDPKHKLLHAARTPWFPPADEATDGGEWTYARRKKLSVQTAAACVAATQQAPAITAAFDASKKKDDLADALWHALAYAARTTPRPDTPTVKKTAVVKRVIARAPNARQRSTGQLSPSNVLHLLKECATLGDIRAALKADPPLARCLKKHFQSPAAFLERFCPPPPPSPAAAPSRDIAAACPAPPGRQ